MHEIVTKQDLAAFKSEFLLEVQKIITPIFSSTKEYLNSAEVRKMLKISDTKLYELRRYKKIPFIKVGGKYLYPFPDLINNLK
ncbi:MAG: helix-turn-helix domain-containing protein [Bacteroidia bacterium]